MIPIRVQVVTICDRLHFYRWFSVLFKNLYHILQAVWGVYQLAQVPLIAETSMPIAENCIKTQPATGTNFTTARRMCICFNNQTHPYPPDKRISLACIIVISRDTSPSAGLSFSRIRTCNSSRAFNIYQRTASISETPIHQVEPVLGTTAIENWQLQDRNQPQDITDILGTAAYQGYIQTPIQTLDGMYVNQLKHFLPLAEQAKCLAEEIHKEKQAKQWAGIAHEKLLKQFFLDQLNSLQILEQLAPLQLAKEHLPSDIIDILERLGKVDNIHFNQHYYIAENCADRYYSKVIKTFVFLMKRQFANKQTLLINTAHLLKFLEEYANKQAQIWKVLHKYHNFPDDVEDLHFHFDSFKSSIKTDFKHLKEAMSCNMQNIQMSLGIQQTYSSTLCSHVNNIYTKLSELQKHIQQHCMYPHQSDKE